jgi:glycosyltransferase involved in cell wall biosynthesis
MRVVVMQADDRPWLSYLQLTMVANRRACALLGYEYRFEPLPEVGHGFESLDVRTRKVPLIASVLERRDCDVLVFLDSDAWVHSPALLRRVVDDLVSADKTGSFSRDPYEPRNTFINSGSFVLRNADPARAMYRTLLDAIAGDPSFHSRWPYDQWYTSRYVHAHKDRFVVYVPEVLNTPHGGALRHNWYKDERMYADLRALEEALDDTLLSSHRDDELLLDEAPWPNGA